MVVANIGLQADVFTRDLLSSCAHPGEPEGVIPRSYANGQRRERFW